MSKLCFIFFYCILYTCCIVKGNVVNTGTVLFTSSDVQRQCWHPEEIAVLTSRMILQDLLPDTKILEISNDDYVDDIVEYFRLLFEVVQKSTQGRSRRITMIALSDLIGGYLQHAVLPMARLAYYAGIIDYFSMEKLIQLYEELKWFLRTNGQGWARPLQPKTDYEIQPIDLSNEKNHGNKSCCRNLIYYDRTPAKRSADNESSTKLFFPVPFFDSKVRPTAIAVPFKRFALRNIESKRAAYMVMKYYISVHNCLNDLHADKTTVDNFQNTLFSWIEKNVLPKLKDDKFYSAFGGILRVQESLKSQGAKVSTGTATECFENEGDQELGVVPGGEKQTSSKSNVLLIAMIVTIVVWFIIGTVFICYRIRANSKKAALSKIVGVSTESSSSFGSSSRWSSSKRTIDTCKCCTTATEKSTEINSSLSSEFDKDDYSKVEKRGSKSDKSLLKGFSFLGKSTTKEQPYGRICRCDEPPIIDTQHSMKMLPSIPEMSENSSSKQNNSMNKSSKSKKITFEDALATSSLENVVDPRKTLSSRIKVCVPKVTGAMDANVTACPYYNDKATSLSSFRSKSSSGKELGTQMSEPGLEETIQKPETDVVDETVNNIDNTTGETSDNTIITANSPHIYACHSSLTGNYTTDQRFQTEKPFIFGYDFQTSSSSELSDEESDTRTSTTK